MLSKKEMGRIQPSTHQEYLDAKSEQTKRCQEHADLVRECRRKQFVKLFFDLKSMSNQLASFETIPDDPKPSDKENTKNQRKRKNDQPLKFDSSNKVLTKD